MVALKTVVLVVLVAFLGHKIIRFLSIFDINKIAFYHEPGPCRLVPGVHEGSEDVQVFGNGVALITSGMRMPMPGTEYTINRTGRILKFDFKNPEAGVEEVKIVNPEEMLDLNPHGLHLWEDEKTGQIRVFVVNHPIHEKVDYICIFEYDMKSNTLRHLKSVTHREFGLMNDVVATGPESFYTTAMNYFHEGQWLNLAEVFFELRWGSIYYYDGQEAKKAVTGLLLPNGINMSQDKKFIYLASPYDRNIKIYKRNADNSLTYVREIALGTSPDNINIDIENGDLWMGAHPIGYQLYSHMLVPTNPAPSQVLRIRLTGDSQFSEEVFSEPSLNLFGSSAAERYKDAILIGTVQHKLMYCKIKHISQ